MLRSPSHAFLHRTIQATFFIFFFPVFGYPTFFRILLCVQSSTSFHRYFSVRWREEQSKIFACKSVSKLTVAFVRASIRFTCAKPVRKVALSHTCFRGEGIAFQGPTEGPRFGRVSFFFPKISRERTGSLVPTACKTNFNNRSMDNGLVLINSRDPIERRVTKATFALFAFLLKSERILPAAFQFFFQAKYWQAGEKYGTRKRKIDEQFRNSIDRRPIQR